MADAFRYDRIPRGSAVLCALSGGADSMYLLCRLMEGAQQGGYSLRAAHFNHGLRPAADGEEQFVRDWCEAHGVPLTVGRDQVALRAGRMGLGIEEAARELRYAFLQKTAADTGCSLIVTGHHAGDNGETILMNLIRGCGLRGLSGIPEERENILRPMLGVTREEILAYLSQHGVPHVEDESNEDPAYTRNRIRHQLIPLLEELNPQALRHILETARQAGEDEAELDRQALALLDREGEPSVSAAALAAAPRPLALRALRRLAPRAQAVHLEAMLELCRREDPSIQIHIPGGTARRVYDRLVVCAEELTAPEEVPLEPGSLLWGGWRVTCRAALCPEKAYLSPEEFYLLPGAYTVRSRREGDTLQLGQRPCKSVKELMIEKKIPRHLRHTCPLLADGAGRAAACGGLGPHRDALARPGEQSLHITVEKEV